MRPLHSRPLQTASDLTRPLQTVPDRFIPIQTVPDRFRPLQTTPAGVVVEPDSGVVIGLPDRRAISVASHVASGSATPNERLSPSLMHSPFIGDK